MISLADLEDVEIPKEWLERAKKQKERFERLSPDEKASWGLTEPTIADQRELDEKRNPSKN